MVSYKIIINDRNYQDWHLVETLSLNEINKIDIEPTKSKLFSNDVFQIDDNKLNITYSSVRTMTHISGILVLNNSKTFGKYKDKYLYKCIPDDKSLPIFIIPYKLKLGFSKNINNKYIIFCFDNWNGKHPQGTIINVLGDVDILSNYYEYQLYCNNLYNSIQPFNKDVNNALKQKTEQEFISSMIKKYNLIDRTNESIFSIDSDSTSDYDDAYSISCNDTDCYTLSIYIANVPLWMEELNLWNSFSERVSTIYLPDRKLPMIPLLLSNGLCSLCENVVRFAFTLDITIIHNEIIRYKFENTYVRLYKNYVYDSISLKKDKNYRLLMKVVDNLSTVYKYTSNIKNSHIMVSYLMILMNYYTALEMVKYNNGIFRSVKINHIIERNPNLSDNVNNFLKIQNSSSGQYDLYDDKKCHEMLKLDAYIHCTSPIRRMVDLLNMTQLQKNLLLVDYSDNFEKCNQYWCDNMNYINITMRKIRKIQNDCNLLDMCSNNPIICSKEHDGYVFDKIVRTDGLYEYNVYLAELNTCSRIILHFELDDYNKYSFRVFIFNDENSLKKKIRLHITIQNSL